MLYHSCTASSVADLDLPSFQAGLHHCATLQDLCRHLHLSAVCCLLLLTHLPTPCAGDSVVFERRGEERSVLYVTLVKASKTANEFAEPATKKRRIARKQAVQRLD